jgi:hypothetical protein
MSKKDAQMARKAEVIALAKKLGGEDDVSKRRKEMASLLDSLDAYDKEVKVRKAKPVVH